jgi:kynurenine formamidase
MVTSPLSFNIFIHALQLSSSSVVFDYNRNIPSTVFLSSCNLICLICLLKYKENNISWQFYSKIVKPDDIVLLYTGTSDHWDQNESIMQNYTYLEPSAAKWIVDYNIKCIGMDSVSVEKYNFQEGLLHRTLLSKNIGIIEALNSNLKKCVGKRMFLVCLPLFLRGIDGAPARVIVFDVT